MKKLVFLLILLIASVCNAILPQERTVYTKKNWPKEFGQIRIEQIDVNIKVIFVLHLLEPKQYVGLRIVSKNENKLMLEMLMTHCESMTIASGDFCISESLLTDNKHEITITMYAENGSEVDIDVKSFYDEMVSREIEKSQMK